MKHLNNKPQYTLYRNDVRHIIRRVMNEDIFDWRNSLFEHVHSYLHESGYNIDIKNQKSISINGREIILRDSLAVIRNNATEDYFCLDCHDWPKPEDYDLMLGDDKCIRILKCQYNKDAYNSYNKKIKPWTYFDRYWPLNENKLSNSKTAEPVIKKLYFRGQTWGIREKLLNELVRMGIMNSDYSVIKFEKYLEESSQYIIMLSLPGVADVCHRDIEAFASGVCVLRPRIKNSFFNELVPDYHYLSIDIDIFNDDAQKCADLIKEKFHSAIKDTSSIQKIADNAKTWYENNVRRESALKLTRDLLDMPQAG